MKPLLITALLAATALIISANASGATKYKHYYVDTLKISNLIEKRGIYWDSRHRAIDNASCLGLRRFGVRTSAYGLDKFWRFKCELNGADNHFYTVQVSTTNGPQRGYWYMHQLSAIRDF